MRKNYREFGNALVDIDDDTVGLVVISKNRTFIFKIDREDLPRVMALTWFSVTNGSCTYGAGYIGAKTHIKLHRLIMSFPESFVDHIDGDTFNNKKSNLRIASSLENKRNQTVRKDCKSGFKGVGIVKDKFRATIRFNGKSIHLGYFESKEKAAIAYNQAALKYFSDFARLNVITDDI